MWIAGRPASRCGPNLRARQEHDCVLITGAFVLKPDVSLIPVSDLDPAIRRRIACGDDDFAVTLLRSRMGSTVVDAQGAALIEQFRRPRTIVDAVILYSRPRGLDPNEVLDVAYRVVLRLLENRLLVAA